MKRRPRFRIALAAVAAAALAVPIIGGVQTASADEPAPQFTFVDCQAPTGGDGTIESPLSSLDAVNAVKLSAGDHVFFKRGTTCDGSLQPQGSGEAGEPIVIDAYGDEADEKPHIRGGGVEEAVLLHNQEYWEIRNLQISNIDADEDERYTHERRGLVIALEDFGQGDYYRVSGLEIHDVYGEGKKDLGGSGGIQLEVYANADNSKRVKTWFNDVVIEDNSVENVNRSGINMSTAWKCRAEVGWNGCAGADRQNLPWTPFTGLVIRGNTVTNVGGDGIVIQMSSNALVEHNTVSDVANMPNGSNAGVWAWNADGTVFQYNEVFNVKRLSDNNDGTAFDADYGTTETVFQYNYSHDNEGGMMLYCGCGGLSTKVTFRYNISENDSTRTNFVAGGTENAYYNNTIIAPDAEGYLLNNANGSGTSMLMANNLVIATKNVADQSDDHDANAIVWRNNAFSGPGTGWPTGEGNVSIDETLPLADAEGMERFAIRDDRLANAGIPIAEPGTQDLLGNAVPSTCAPDIGAVQFSAVADDCGVVDETITAGETRADAPIAAQATYRVTTTAGSVSVVNPAGFTTPPAESGDTVFTSAMDATTVDLTCTSEENCEGVTMAVVQNLAIDPSFESASNTPWGYWNIGRDADHAVSGEHALQINGAGSAEQRVLTVLPNTDYTLSGWIASTEGHAVRLGFKNFQGNQDPNNPDQVQDFAEVSAPEMTHTSLSFNSGTSDVLSIYCYRPGGTGNGYCDDITLTADTTQAQAALQPHDTMARVGHTVTFTAAFVGIDRGNISWQRLDGGAWVTLENAVGSALSIDGVEQADDGAQYRAVVRGAEGLVASDPATLSVQSALAAASVVTAPEDAAVSEGENVNFVAEATGSPTPSIRWQQSVDGETWTDVDGADGAELTLTSVTADRDGTQFRAAVSNPFGTVYSDTASLRVTGAVPPPGGGDNGDDTDEGTGSAGPSTGDDSSADGTSSTAGELPYTGGVLPFGIITLALALVAGGAALITRRRLRAVRVPSGEGPSS